MKARLTTLATPAHGSPRRFAPWAFAFAALLVLGCKDKEKDGGSATKAPPAPSTATPAAVDPAPPASAAPTAAPPGRDVSRVEFPEVPIRGEAPTAVHVKWKAPDGTGVNDEAPFRVRWTTSDSLETGPADVKATGAAAREGFSIEVKPIPGTPAAKLEGVIDLVVCALEDHSVCVPVKRKIDIEFVVAKEAKADVTVAVELPRARVL